MSAKGDLMSVKGDLISVKGDLLSAKGDLSSAKGDLISAKGDLMSTQHFNDVILLPWPTVGQIDCTGAYTPLGPIRCTGTKMFKGSKY